MLGPRYIMAHNLHKLRHCLSKTMFFLSFYLIHTFVTDFYVGVRQQLLVPHTPAVQRSHKINVRAVAVRAFCPHLRLIKKNDKTVIYTEAAHHHIFSHCDVSIFQDPLNTGANKFH